jgi:hypothetical protein
MQVVVDVIAHHSKSGPLCVVELNGNILHKGILPKGANNLVFDVSTDQMNYLRIHHFGKTNEDTIVDETGEIIADKAIELTGISIEGVCIMDNVLYNKPYFVKWPDNIIQDYKNNGEDPPEFINNTLFFGFNGHYEFDFVGDFLKQYSSTQ